MRKYAPTIQEVRSAGYGGGAGGVISLAVIWLLGCWVWGASWDASKANEAMAAVPYPINALIVFVFGWVGAHAAGWLAHNGPTPDPPPTPPVVKSVIMDHGLDVLHTEPVPEV